MRSCWIPGVSPKPSDKCPRKDPREGERAHVTDWSGVAPTLSVAGAHHPSHQKVPAGSRTRHRAALAGHLQATGRGCLRRAACRLPAALLW